LGLAAVALPESDHNVRSLKQKKISGSRFNFDLGAQRGASGLGWPETC
jgi:hypothetical protein